jgi:hypothetical protein
VRFIAIELETGRQPDRQAISPLSNLHGTFSG